MSLGQKKAQMKNQTGVNPCNYVIYDDTHSAWQLLTFHCWRGFDHVEKAKNEECKYQYQRSDWQRDHSKAITDYFIQYNGTGIFFPKMLFSYAGYGDRNYQSRRF